MCGTIHHNNVCHWTAGTLRYLIVIDVLVRHYFWEKISGATALWAYLMDDSGTFIENPMEIRDFITS